MKVSYIVGAGVGIFVAVVAVDHFVLKGRLGISGHINKLIGQIKQSLGQGAGPIEPAMPPEGGFPPQSGGEGTALEEQLLAEQEALAMEEPETASWARARMAARRARQARRRVRLGGYGV